jgi:hypothetical protein
LKYIAPYDYAWGDGSVLLSATKRTIEIDCDPLDPQRTRPDPITGECMRDEDKDGVPDGVDKCSDPNDPQDKDYVYDSKYEIAERRGCPACPELYTSGGVHSIIYAKEAFMATSLAQYHADQSQPFDVIFAPSCPSNTAFKIKVKDVSKAAKVDHFNWWQSMRFTDADVYEFPDSYESALVTAIVKKEPLDISQGTLESFRAATTDGWAQDMGENMVNRFNVAIKRKPDANGRYQFSPFSKQIGCSDGPLDRFPYYYNEGGACSWENRFIDENKNFVERSKGFGFHFSDTPTLTEGFVSETNRMHFFVRLAGVAANGRFVNFHVGTDWSSWHTNSVAPGRFNITAGNANNLGPLTEERLSRMSSEGIIGIGQLHAPNYLGRNPSSLETLQFMSDSGFTVRNVSFEFSDSVEKDLVIRQTPEPFVMSTSGYVDIVVSLGKAASCGELSHGSTTTRTLYLTSNVPFGSSCETQREIQTGTCYNGNISWTGTASFETCSVNAPLACGNIPHGVQTTQIRYESATVPFGSSCDTVKETQTATCYNGTLIFDGTFTYESCTIMPSPIGQCIKSKTHVCKANLFEVDSCRIPGKIVEAKVIDTYKNSHCRPEPANLKWWQILERFDTYKIEGDSIKAQLGCQAKFNVKYIGSCK